MIYDIRQDQVQALSLNGRDAIKWCDNDDYWFVQDEDQGIRFDYAYIELKDTFLTDKRDGENLVKAIQKAMELGWLK